MSLEEDDNKEVEQNSGDIIKINCRGKTVYVPYYTALKYDFLRSYIENWKDKQEIKELNIDDYPPELLQSEIDEKTLSVPISTFLGYDDNDKELYFEDLFSFNKDGTVDLKYVSIKTNYTPLGLNEDERKFLVNINGRIKVVRLHYLQGSYVYSLEDKNYKLRTFRTEQPNHNTIVKWLIEDNPHFLSHFFPSRYE